MQMLEVKNMCKRFGGVLANQNISFSFDEGKIIGLIGPNGAGKTTLFNCLVGNLKADEGTALFYGKNIIAMTPAQILDVGIARTFQIPKPFVSMTVLENVMIGTLYRNHNVKKARDYAMEILESTGLAEKANFEGGMLTVPDRKRVEVARALATDPKLIMLDECMSGLNPSEVNDATKLIRDIQNKGITILLIEHIMEVVMPLSDWVLVIDQGKMLAQGLPADIVKNPDVIKAYLGVSKSA